MFEEIIRTLSYVPETLTEFEFENTVYKMIDIDNLTTAELVDLESYYADENIIKVCSILFRPIVPENGYIELYEGTSKYDGITERIPFHFLLGGYMDYIKYRDTFKDRFQYLFREKEETEEELENFDSLVSDEQAFAEEFLQFMNFYKRKCELDSNRIKAPKQA